jgi:glycosyltransferase involved in cell wall biosynthesis
MRIVTYSVVLNQHQAPIADKLWEMTHHEFAFVELTNLGDTKGGTEDYSRRPYLIKSWESPEAQAKAMELARTAECCIFSGVDALPYQKERMKLGLLSFDMGERWLKRGIKSFASPRLWKWLMAYYLNGWRSKPLYKLCCSAFCAGDHHKLGTFFDKCYKWGYFTKVDSDIEVEASNLGASTSEIIPLMWCARFLKLKHPELPVQLAARLKANGYKFVLDMYGSGEELEKTKTLAKRFDVSDVVHFYGNLPNDQILEAMRNHSIFLFTSDKNEGWGAVLNESMSTGCVPVASDAIGSVPYLVRNNENGMIFNSEDIESLYKKVEFLLRHPDERRKMANRAYYTMRDVWSPANAANNLIRLIEDLQREGETSIVEGPCSKEF